MNHQHTHGSLTLPAHIHPNDVWIVIPAYNEALRIGEVLKKTVQYGTHVVVVDDGSTDNTSLVASSFGVDVLKLCVNMGKGTAIKTGCDYVLKNNGRIIVMMDSDGQHKPEHVSLLLDALHHKDIVFGVRTLDENMPFIFRFGNWFINKVTVLLFHIDIGDTQTGFRAFTTEAYKKIRWNAYDYVMESEMLALAGKNNLRYGLVSIPTITHDRYKGTTILTGVKIVVHTILWRIKWS